MRRTDRNSGFVLVIVLWVVAILTVIALGFGRRALLERTAATYALDHAKAMQMARGAVARAMAELANKAYYDNLTKSADRTSYAQQWSRPKDLLAAESDSGDGGGEGKYFEDQGNKEFEGDICAYIIRDEDSRISLNGSLELLDEVPGLSRGLLRKIDVRRKGNEKEPGRLFQTIEELRYMDDIDDDDWFGSEKKPGLVNLLTCFSVPQEDGNVDARVNVNTASDVVLMCIPKLSGAVDAIIGYRAGADGELFTQDDKDFANLEDIPKKIKINEAATEAIRQYCKFSSSCFTITGTATRRNGKIRATCVATVAVGSGQATIFKWREEFLEP